MGWYYITRGFWYKTPDDHWAISGKIFCFWSLFWEQYRSEKKVYFKGSELVRKYELLKTINPTLSDQISVNNDKTALVIKDGFAKAVKEKRPYLEDVWGCVVWVDGPFIMLIATQEVYLFPMWIRFPFSECPSCMSSVYGTAIYYFVVCQQRGLFSWSLKENLAKVGFWVIFCLILACLNTFIDKKIK